MTDSTNIISTFHATAVADFTARMTRVEETATRYLSQAHVVAHYDVRELMTLLCTIPDGERYILLRHIVSCTDGLSTLEGMEALCSFVGNYMLDDSECMVVPEPDDFENDVGYHTWLYLMRVENPTLSEDEIVALAQEQHRNRDKAMVVVPKRSDADRSATAPDVVAAILWNRALEERAQQKRQEFLSDIAAAANSYPRA